MTSESADTTTAAPRADEYPAGTGPERGGVQRHDHPQGTGVARDLDGDAAEAIHTHENGDHAHTDAHPDGHEPHTHAEHGAGDRHHRLLATNEVDALRRRWDSVQASFIDAPREAVAEADRLVSDLTDRITDRFGTERSSLEERWNRGENVSTEDLRQSLQRYRSFFGRLLRL